jgi:hypothetical protein
LCLTCASRVGGSETFPFSRDHFTLDGLINLSLSRWKAHWVLLTFGFGGLIVALYAVSLGGELVFDHLANSAGSDSRLHSPLHPVRLGFQVLTTILQLAVQLLVFGVSLDLLEGRKLEWQRVLSRVQRLPEFIVQTIVTTVALAADLGLHYLLFRQLGGLDGGSRAFLIPIGLWIALAPLRVYVALGIMFSTVALLADPNTNAFSAFGVSWRAVSGHRLQAFGVSLASGVIGGAGAILCCVGAFATLPIASLIYCALFLALTQRERPASALPHEGWQV